MPSTCVFEFDHPETIYYSGETITGRILLSTTKEKNFREIYIQFIGEAKTLWAVSKAFHFMRKRLHHTITYQGRETYIQERKTLLSGAPGISGVLPAGVHEFKFSVELPTELPSSCEEAFGHIRYEISLVIDRKLRFNNVFRYPLTVLRQLNLNTTVDLNLPKKGEDLLYFCCFPCKSGPVKSCLTIPFGGYAPGQHINFSLHVENKSRIYAIKGIKLRFIQTYTFISRTPRIKVRKHSVVLSEMILNETVARSSTGTIHNYLKVPAVPPTTLGDFIVAVHYHIEMVFGASCKSYSKIDIPIIVGTIPLIDSLVNAESFTLFMPTPAPDTPGDEPPNFELMRPAFYEEANTITKRFVDRDVDEHSQVSGYVPKYPVYSYLSISPTAVRENGRRSSSKRRKS